MKKIFYLLLTVVAGACATGCNDDFTHNDETLRPSGTTVRLDVQTAPTRAALDGLSVVWEAGDRIRVNGSDYDLQGNASEGWYIEVPEADRYEAIYPADLVDGSGTVTLPATQHYTPGTFDATAHPMYAEAATADDGLAFHNMCGLLHLQLTGETTLQSIQLTGNHAEPLAGTGSVGPDGFAFLADGSPSTTLSLDFDGQGSLSAEPLSCYLVVPAQEFTQGFTVTIRTTDGATMTRTTSSDEVIARSGMLTMPVIAFEADATTLPDFSDPMGVFILNEGNMTSEQGSLIYIDRDGNVLDNVYKQVNGTELGNTTQDLCIHDGKIYIISQNGGGDGMLVIADSHTLQKQASFSKEQLATLSWPTHVAVLNESNIFVRDNAGLYRLNGSTGELTFIEGSKGASKLTMATIGERVFAIAGKKIFVLEADQTSVAQTIEMSGTVTGIVKSNDGNLFAATSSPAQISKIDAATCEILRTNDVTTGSLSAGWGATPGITAVGDLIYYSGATTTIYCHNFATGESQKMINAADVVANCNIVYNNIAVHPLTGVVYMNTIKAYGWDFLINNISLFRPEGETLVLDTNYENHTHFPAGVFFPANFE